MTDGIQCAPQTVAEHSIVDCAQAAGLPPDRLALDKASRLWRDYAGPVLWAWIAIVSLGAVDLIWADRAGLVFIGWVNSAVPVVFLAESASPTATAGAAAGWPTWATTRRCGWRSPSTGAVLTYLAATLKMPLRDTELRALDAALGFDWFAWSRFVAAHRLLRLVLTGAYLTLLPQIIGSIVYFAHTGQRRGMRNFVDLDGVAADNRDHFGRVSRARSALARRRTARSLGCLSRTRRRGVDLCAQRSARHRYDAVVPYRACDPLRLRAPPAVAVIWRGRGS